MNNVQIHVKRMAFKDRRQNLLIEFYPRIENVSPPESAANSVSSSVAVSIITVKC